MQYVVCACINFQVWKIVFYHFHNLIGFLTIIDGNDLSRISEFAGGGDFSLEKLTVTNGLQLGDNIF